MKKTFFIKGLLIFVALLASVGSLKAVDEVRTARFDSRPIPVQERTEAAEQRVLEQLQAAEDLEENGLIEKGFIPTHPAAFHYVKELSPSGDQLEIEDGSVWSVNPGDQAKVSQWMVYDAIFIGQNKSWFSSYLFKLMNNDTGESAQVDGLLGPYLDSPYAHYASQINYQYPAVRLDDGTWWQVTSSDTAVLEKWLPNDTMIVGINQDWFTWGYHYILINVNTNTFVRASQL